MDSAAGSVVAATPSEAAARRRMSDSGGWPARIHRAAAFAVSDPAPGMVALAGFLLRGGIVVVGIPSVVLPSLLGLASVFGVNALGIDGQPTPWLIAIIAWAIAGAAAWLAIAAIAGSIVDVWLVRASVSGDARFVRRSQPFPEPVLLLDMAGVRVACLLPLGAVIVAVWPAIYGAAYDELTLPTNLADPLLVRVAVRAAVPIAIVVGTWLVTEMIAAIAVRRLVLGAGVLSALGGALGQLVRRPLSSLLTLLSTTAVSVAAIAAATIGTDLAFLLCLDAARLPDPVSASASAGGFGAALDLRPIVFIAAVLVLMMAWVVSLAVSGETSAWRSAAWTEETRAAWRGGNANGVAAPDTAEPPSPAGSALRQTADLKPELPAPAQKP